jgi:hypothetical protein
MARKMQRADMRTTQKLANKTLEEFCEDLCRYLKTGVTIKTAAEAVGISEATYHLWLRKGKAGIEPYATFADKIRETFPKTEAVLAGRVINASEKDWRAAAWMLERRNRKDWGKSYGTTDELASDFINNLTIEELRNEVKKMHAMTTQSIEERALELEEKLAAETVKVAKSEVKKSEKRAEKKAELKAKKAK